MFRIFKSKTDVEKLFVAILKNDTNEATKIIDKMDDFSQKNACGDTVLMKAIYMDNIAIATKIIDKMDDFSQQNECGNTALIEAIYKGSTSIVAKLIDKMNDFSQQNDWDNTALIYAIDKEYTSIAKNLIKKMTYVCQQNKYGDTALDVAKKRGNKALIKLIKLKIKNYDITPPASTPKDAANETKKIVKTFGSTAKKPNTGNKTQVNDDIEIKPRRKPNIKGF